MKKRELKRVATIDLMLELDTRKDVQWIKVGENTPYEIRAKAGAVPISTEDEPQLMLVVRRKSFNEWSLEKHMLEEQRERGTDKKKNQVTNEIKLALFSVACFIGTFVGCIFFKLVIEPLLFG